MVAKSTVRCVVSNGVMYLLGGDASVAKVMQFVLQSLQVPRGLQEVLGEDLLLLPGVGGHSDGVPDLNQDGLMRWGGEEGQFRPVLFTGSLSTFQNQSMFRRTGSPLLTSHLRLMI